MPGKPREAVSGQNSRNSGRCDSGEMPVTCDVGKSCFLSVVETKGQLKWMESRMGGKEEKAVRQLILWGNFARKGKEKQGDDT